MIRYVNTPESPRQQPLLADFLFAPLQDVVQRFGIKTIIETGTGPSSSGMAAAERLGLNGYTCDVYQPWITNEQAIHPQFNVFHASSEEMLKEILPNLEGPTFFWLDGHFHTDATSIPASDWPLYEEIQLIKQHKKGYEKDVIWCDDFPWIVDTPEPWTLHHPIDLNLGGIHWHGERAHTFDDYLALLNDTHIASVLSSEQDKVLCFTPKV